MPKRNKRDILSGKRPYELPDVSFRPQMSSWLKVELRRKVERYDTHKEFTRTFENPDRNWMKDFEPAYRWNQVETQNFVEAFNSRKSDAETWLVIKRNAYLESFEAFNLCWKCKQPLKTKKARVYHGKSEPRTPDEIVGRVNKTDGGKRRFQISARNVSVRTFTAQRGFEDLHHHDVIVEFKGHHYKPTLDALTDEFADIIPHFETRETASGKWIYVFIDGTGILKGVKPNKKKGKRGQPLFFVLSTKEELPDFRPQPYRVFNAKCGCIVK